MPAYTGTILEVVLVREIQNQDVLNVMHYALSDESVLNDLDSVMLLLANKIVTQLDATCDPSVYFDRLTYRNIYDDSISGEVIIDVNGTGTDGHDLPVHDTFSLSLIHDEPSIRTGRKSVSGVTETDSLNGKVGADSYVAISNALHTAFGEPLTVSEVDVLRPIVVKRIAEVVDGVTKYRLPNISTEALVGFVYDTILSIYIGTMLSRKR